MLSRYNQPVFLPALVVLLLSSFIISPKITGRAKVLVFFKTRGYHHGSITFGIAAVQKLGAANGYDVDTTTNAESFTDSNLKQYRAVVFLSTTGNVLNGGQQAAFERYIQAGGGYAGIHAAADTEYDWPWYNKLVGGYFESHPHAPNVREAIIDVTDKDHPATTGLPRRWKRTDEWYNYRSLYSGIKVLANLDENSYEGGTNGSNHPIAWYHDFDGGRAFYTGCGHTDESYNEPSFLKHLQGGIQYAMGDDKPLDYARAYAKITPEQNRFVKTVLTSDINSPMELAVANDGRIFYTQLFGELSVFNTKTNKCKLIHKFGVTTIGGTGLIGITLDPNFAINNFLYLYYAPAGQTEDPLYFQLSRFKLSAANILDLSSEKILLKVPVQKNSGSHHGGSLAWDGKGNLFLSTGDSSTPFPSNGYAPLDERPDKQYYSEDSQRSAGNTNDLKGKILRIHPEADGTYTIPAGNLFPKGMAKTLPEIYVMGVRNPYRIAINKRTSTLYWGDIGPDAGNDSPRGPRGYDEFNQAKEPGNYGWPYFAGNNFAYAKWDFATGKPGPLFNPKAPVNNSPNNTGLAELPQAIAPMVWYPYVASEQFPELGLGGRCAIGGDVYLYNKNNTNPGRFPDYYDGYLFVADWMRNWVMAMRFDGDENYLRTEPFMAANGDFRRPIDMAFGSEGILYMLEYGSVYGVANKDARLVKITYNRGNRAPIARATIIDTAVEARVNRRAHLTSDFGIPQLKAISGQAPLQVSFSGRGSLDLDDDDEVNYQWLFDGKTPGSKTQAASYIYRKPGIYQAILKVTDKAGLVGRDTLLIKVGNTAPVVSISGSSNKSFYWKDKPFEYAIKVSDREDGRIDPARIKAFYVYNATPAFITAADVIKPGFGELNYPGKAIMAASDCKACHQLNSPAVGPSFTAIANHYKTDSTATDKLAAKIIAGGGGNWSKDHVMSAHPQLALADAREIVKYIFSLTDKKHSNIVQIPLQGAVTLNYNDAEPQGEYTFIAAYTDKGGNIVGPLKTTSIITLRQASFNPAFSDVQSGFPRFRDNLSEGGNNAYLLMKNIDLTGIGQFVYKYGARYDGELQVRLDSRAGPIISSVKFKSTGSFDKADTVKSKLDKVIAGRHDVYFYVVKRDKPNDSVFKFHSLGFEQ